MANPDLAAPTGAIPDPPPIFIGFRGLKAQLQPVAKIVQYGQAVATY